MEGEKKRSRSFSFPSSSASFLFLPPPHASHWLTQAFSVQRGWSLALYSGTWMIGGWLCLNFEKKYITAFLFGNYWHYSQWILVKSAYLSLLVKGVIGVSLNTQQNKPLFNQFSFMQNSASLKMWAAYWGCVRVSQSVICIQLYCNNKCTSPQTTVNDSIRTKQIILWKTTAPSGIRGRERLKALIWQSCCSTAISEKIPMDSLF